MMFTPEEIARLRRETPGTARVIHFNNAGSALPPDSVRDAMMDYLQEEMTCGGYETYARHLDELESIYESIARLIHADREEIAIQENATVAWNAAFQAIDFNDGDVILTNQAEYASNYLAYLHLRKRVKVTIAVIPNDEQGQADVEAFEAMIHDRVKLVSITHMPTNGGLVTPAEAIGKLTRKHNILYLLDACQSAGQYPLDVQKLGCDMLSTTGRKYMRGPRGTGFLYVRKTALNRLTPCWVDLHAARWTGKNTYHIRNDARKFENWERSYANTLGLKAATDYILKLGISKIWERVRYLGDALREQLDHVPGVRVHDVGAVKSGIVSFTVAGRSAQEVKDLLFRQKINVSWNDTYNTRLDMEARELQEIVRASVHYYNTEEEIHKLISTLQRI